MADSAHSTAVQRLDAEEARTVFCKQAIPSRWFNVIPHLPEPIPVSQDPQDGKESRVECMKRIRVAKMVEQDSIIDPWIDIPQAIYDEYLEVGRPTPLYRARTLERALCTPARLYFKREDLLPTGSFKLNSAIAQAYYAAKEGAVGLVTETGAGQWGHSLAYACNRFGLEAVVFWVKVSKAQKPYRVVLSQLLGATIYDSPSDRTASGRCVLGKDPECTGSIGSAIGDAISFAMDNPEYKYVSGSNLPHVLLHQTVIGLETRAQLTAIGESPTHLVACVGGGSNLGGFMNPFLPEKLQGTHAPVFFAAESDVAPRLTEGQYRYDHADPAGLTPLTLSYTLGMDYVPPAVHVGGLRQHSGSAIVGLLRKHGLLEARAYNQADAFKAGQLMAELERILPAPESCHAVKAVIDLATAAKASGESLVIVACLSGHGILDLQGYKNVLGL
uniref:tryptophan synthase n=1 Tax=Candidatus Kentrum sp. MB TaxID=2138164 RepID=A0A450X8J4_9GAMM|nr:MAG: tryptophan synthase beta chain/tryptophan synthase beta chain [Candidatus Kentron sp. MB]VFK29651.1 MAG: tryptophan synthase beta chain/tryptophan synthase beta chain [Candidatus Kentron sp. MB]VFK74855.1 MAG: tryptophan synthase beta chain/tryptophan synthase beta chain [Candidatus Kentron sp. MB]